MEMEVDTMMAQRPDFMHHHADSKKRWTAFLAKAVHRRLDMQQFESYISILHSQNPLPPTVVADLFLSPQPSNHHNLDPRVQRFLQVLSNRKLVDTPSVLNGLYKYSTLHKHAENIGNPLSRWASSYSTEETIFYRLSKAVRQGTGINSTSEAIRVCSLMAKWMKLFTTAAATLAQDVMGQLQNPQARDEMETARAAFVLLFLGICENEVILRALSRPSGREARRVLSRSLAIFIPSILQSSSEIAGRLELFRTHTLAAFEPAGAKNEAASTEIDDILDSSMAVESIVVPELPIANSRAGLYIYLNAALVGRPLLDDAAFFNYLHNRYQGDIQSTTVDLILASFDVLANAVFRNEGQKTGHLLRSYLINKLPLLLATLATSMFSPLTPQFCITEALSRVDTNAFPTLSAMFDDTNNNNTFTDSVRQDFCFACCLHDLIPESSIERLLGEITYQTLPAGGRYARETLVEECLADPERVQSLISELDHMDGNVGAVCQALTEVIGRLCANKETVSLKLLCSQLAKKPLSLDVMLLFDKPTTILHPLCELLDNWRYDEDQGEYQPIYEEFGSLLLFLFVFVFRYNLTAADLGIRSPDSFITKLFNRGRLSKSLDELTDQEKGHLDGWIHGLFDTEAGGLGDELMSSCPPQDFYLLVPTLFHNTVIAFSSGSIDEESLKTGIEYLVDPFLLPSLVMAITYMSSQLWIDRSQDQKAVIRILQLTILTKQGSNEAQTMLSAVLNIVAKPLEHSLRSYQRRDPKCQEIEPLLKAIRDNTKVSRRTGGAGHNELEAWTSTANGGLAASVRHTFQGFVQWSLQPGINVMPTSYTHRQVLAALKSMGAKRLLYLILEEVKQADVGSESLAHDVATALICAPDVTNVPPPIMLGSLMDPAHPPIPPQTRISLRGALKSEAEDYKSIAKTDQTTADNIIRLYRRVEAQLLMPQHQADASILQDGLALGLDEENAAALGDAIAAAQNEVANDNASLNLDLNTAANGMSLGGGGSAGDATGAGALVDFGNDDDIFGSLGAAGGDADLDLEGWDGLDMS